MRDSALKLVRRLCLHPLGVVGEELMRDSALKLSTSSYTMC